MNYFTEITFWVFVGSFSFLFLIFIILAIFLKKQNNFKKQFLKGKNGKDLETVIVEQKNKIEKLEEKMSSLDDSMKQVRKTDSLNIRKVGFIRYDSFKDVGGEQSFSLAVLNSLGNGYVISSLHSRAGTRIYAKTIKKKDSEYPLSEEEKKAIEEAYSKK